MPDVPTWGLCPVFAVLQANWQHSRVVQSLINCTFRPKPSLIWSGRKKLYVGWKMWPVNNWSPAAVRSKTRLPWNMHSKVESPFASNCCFWPFFHEPFSNERTAISLMRQQDKCQRKYSHLVLCGDLVYICLQINKYTASWFCEKDQQVQPGI